MKACTLVRLNSAPLTGLNITRVSLNKSLWIAFFYGVTFIDGNENIPNSLKKFPRCIVAIF